MCKKASFWDYLMSTLAQGLSEKVVPKGEKQQAPVKASWKLTYLSLIFVNLLHVYLYNICFTKNA